MNKHELSAWWRFGLSCVYGAYLFWVLFLADLAATNTALNYIMDSMFAFVVLLLFSGWYVQRREGVDQDERDRTITMSAIRIALLALLVIVGLTPLVFFEIILGVKETVTFHLDWAKFYVNACLTLIIWLEATVTVFLHWRDRR